MTSIVPTLNILCTCTECTTFLRPINPFPSLPSPTKVFVPKSIRAPSWIDKLSLSAYDIQTVTPPVRANQLTQPLSLITSTSTSTATSTSSPGYARSVFPKTLGTLRCTHTNCRVWLLQAVPRGASNMATLQWIVVLR
ncbi:hypothetical protein BDW02DRAFT_352165 [Decorospora gaudefroyi]|uniref:Uncharacterized protein n=1 Tax=Decorospora gaudefroyi TaxID=184978 RepID=A0A6A5K9J6_9PLEO|nr:hypothetical protein BDW02DRAFT_352165 [Decorospora gaudefroyi]